MKTETFLPVEVVFAPSWWHKRHGICFDRDFFFDPTRRVQDERRMRSVLAEVFGDIGLGERCPKASPVVGAVNLASGYFIAEALGCDVVYHLDAPPDVISANLNDDNFFNWHAPDIFETRSMKDLITMFDTLRPEFGYLEGDINWSGVQNTALDLRGNALFMDYYDRPEETKCFLESIANFIISFVEYVSAQTGTSSISVNRSVALVDRSINMHSNCSVAMVSKDLYEEFLLPIDKILAAKLKPFGIHHCGSNMDSIADSYAKIEEAQFFDVGWGSNVKACREALPNVFLNLRLSPARMAVCSPNEVIADVNRLAIEGNVSDLTGFCCVNLDDTVPDENVRALFAAVDQIREEGLVR